MKKFVKILAAVSGVTLLAVACAPAFKGEGINKPNLQKQLDVQHAEVQTQEKALTDQADLASNIITVNRGKQLKNGKGYRYQITIDKADDLGKPQRVFGINVSLVQDEIAKVERENSDHSTVYKIEAKCLNGCDALIAVLTRTPKANLNVAPSTTGATLKQEVQVAVASQSDVNNEDNQSAEAANTPAVVSAGASMTGAVAKSDGQIVLKQRFDIGTDTKDAMSQLEEVYSKDTATLTVK